MSNFDESGLPKEVAECMDTFDTQRQMVYDWLGEKTAQDISVFSYANKVGELVSALSEVFAETSTTIADCLKDERRVAGYLIASAWFLDTGDRLRFLTQRMPLYIKFDKVERSDIEGKVSSILEESEDISDTYNLLGRSYFEPAAKDFGQFLNVRYREHEMRMRAVTAHITGSQPDVLTYEVTAEQIGADTAQNEALWLAGYLKERKL